MKKGAFFGLGCLTSLIIMIFIFGVSIYSLSKLATNDSVAINNNSLLTISLQGPVTEYSRFANDRFFNKQTTVFDITKAIKIAKNDPRIEAILLKPEFTAMGYASLNEIINALEDFKNSGKPVYAFLTMASNSDMMLASIADEITISASTSAGVFLKGFGVDMAYYKSMFEKIGIKMHIISAGKYKDYGTQYSHDTMSQETKENLSRVLQGRLDLFVHQVSKQLDVSTIIIESIINNEEHMFLEPDETIMTSLVDNKAFAVDYMKRLETKYNNQVDYKNYLKGNQLTLNKKENNKISVLYLNGNIMPFENNFSVLTSKWIGKSVDNILSDKSIKACVLRINSSGGSALESEEILQSLKRLKQKMPVVVSMGDVAASGGYMISMASNKIFADPYTITGSIGVVQMVPDTKGLQDKLGINHEKIEFGKKSTWLNPLNGVSDEQLLAYKKSADNVYDTFKEIVFEGRAKKLLTLEQVESLAQGQIWDALSARKKGLIDEIGSLDDAINEASQLANIQTYNLDYFPRQKDFFQYMLSNEWGITQLKSILLKNTSEQLYQQKFLLDSFLKHNIQTILPMEFEK